MKLTLKSISQDVDISDPDSGQAFLVFEADVVPVGVPTTLRIPMTDDAVKMVIDYLGLVNGSRPAEREEYPDSRPEPEEAAPEYPEGAETFPPTEDHQEEFPEDEETVPSL